MICSQEQETLKLVDPSVFRLKGPLLPIHIGYYPKWKFDYYCKDIIQTHTKLPLALSQLVVEYVRECETFASDDFRNSIEVIRCTCSDFYVSNGRITGMFMESHSLLWNASRLHHEDCCFYLHFNQICNHYLYSSLASFPMII